MLEQIMRTFSIIHHPATKWFPWRPIEFKYTDGIVISYLNMTVGIKDGRVVTWLWD